MKKLKGSFAAKLIAVLLLCALAVVFGASMAGIYLLGGAAAVNGDQTSIKEKAVDKRAWTELYDIWEQTQAGIAPQKIVHDPGFRFTLIDAEGTELYSDYADEPVIWKYVSRMEQDISVMEAAEGAPILVTVLRTGEALTFDDIQALNRWQQANTLTLRGYVLSALPAGSAFAQQVAQMTWLYAERYTIITAAAGSFLLGVLLFLFLLAAAGHHGEEPVRESFVDRIPLDVFTLLAGTAFTIALVAPADAGLTGNLFGYIVFGLCVLAAALVALLYCMSFAVRVKCGTIWQNCLIARFFRWLSRLLKKLGTLLRDGLHSLPLIRRWALILGGVTLAELLVMAASRGRLAGLLWFVNLVLGLPAALYALIGFARLRQGAKAIAAGDLRYTVDETHLRGELREHAADLNRIRDGIGAAVDERMKSQRFQSELITNVSHDIKTPLTGIISYVELLEKEELDNETARGYVEVLSRQSQRLKKLLDDLLEASKASAGVLPVKLEPCELGVLLDQCTGEYGERLEAAGLHLVVTKPEAPVTIPADGRHLWRVLDNLLSNILKYAQPGTRVYMNLARAGSEAVLTFRNISREPLNLSGEELLARFVRGDSARSTEGSGLGLAIAQSLTELQGGRLSLEADGDLFKVTLRFEVQE